MLSRGTTAHQGFADQLSVGISDSLICDLPYLTVRRTQAFANSIKLRSPASNHGSRERSSVDLSCGGCEFGGGVINRATLVYDVGEDASH